MEKLYGEKGLVVVGIHTPEFDHERSRKNVEAAVEKHELTAHSHLLDNSMAYWRALRNEYWPAIYVVDRCRKIREATVGEIHLKTSHDAELRKTIEKLLQETPPNCG